MSSAAVEALIDERIETFKLELSSIVHAAIDDALERYRRSLRPVHAPAAPTPAPPSPGAEAPEAVQGSLWEERQPVAAEPAMEPAAGAAPGRPAVDPFWSEAAARLDERPAAAAQAGAPVATGEARAGSGRRSPEELEELGRRVLEQLAARDGATVLAVARELGQPTSELRRPVQLLIAAGAIEQRSTAEGQRLYRR